jgi:hypothetical protein
MIEKTIKVYELCGCPELRADAEQGRLGEPVSVGEERS